MKYNIAIIPPEDICNRAISISQNLFEYGGIFKLGKKINFPHVTIGHLECSDEIFLGSIINNTQKITKQINKFDIVQDKYDIYKNEWVFVSFMLSNALRDVEQQIKNILMINNIEKTSKDFDDFPAHITFSRMSIDDVFDIGILPKYDFSFTVDKIGIFELGEHGINKRLLKEFKLQ